MMRKGAREDVAHSLPSEVLETSHVPVPSELTSFTQIVAFLTLDMFSSTENTARRRLSLSEIRLGGVVYLSSRGRPRGVDVVSCRIYSHDLAVHIAATVDQVYHAALSKLYELHLIRLVSSLILHGHGHGRGPDVCPDRGRGFARGFARGPDVCPDPDPDPGRRTGRRTGRGHVHVGILPCPDSDLDPSHALAPFPTPVPAPAPDLSSRSRHSRSPASHLCDLLYIPRLDPQTTSPAPPPPLPLAP